MKRGDIAANFYFGCAIHDYLERALPPLSRASSNQGHFARLVLGAYFDSSE